MERRSLESIMAKPKYIAGEQPTDYKTWKETNKEALFERFQGSREPADFTDFCEFEHSKFVKRTQAHESGLTR
jgi:hypothetical protein